MYNPINAEIIDEKRLQEKDLREKNKKKRYEARTEIDKKQHEDGDANKARKDEQAMKRISYMRVREANERGFNILNNEGDQAQKNAAATFTKFMQKERGVWDKLGNQADTSARNTGAGFNGAQAPTDT